MNLTGRCLPRFSRPLITGLLVIGLLAGCKNFLVPQHKVTVDAICAPNVEKPAGMSFRLVGKKASIATGQVEIAVVAACVTAALAHAGMYEAPAIAPADLIIEVSCGQDIAPRADPSTKESFLELSARTNKAKAMDTTREPEIWNVRISIQGLAGRIEPAMPLLAAVAASYTASDTKFQTMIEVPQKNASIAAVREAALKTLDARAAARAAAAGTNATAPATPSTGGSAAAPEK